MYWTDWGTVGKIEKASMDGSNRSVIHNTSLVWPNGLTLDYSTQVLYWTDASLDKIESSNVDGSNRRVLVNISGSHPFGITLFEDTLYFSDWQDAGIFSTSKSGGQAVQSLIDTNVCGQPFGIQIVTEERQPQGMLSTNMGNRLFSVDMIPVYIHFQGCPFNIPVLMSLVHVPQHKTHVEVTVECAVTFVC